MSRAATMIRIVAQPPIFPATIYELMRLRCNSCLAIFTAKAPPEAGETKYSEAVPSMLAVLRYGSGMPLFPIEVGVCTDVVMRALRASLGIDLQELVHEEMKRAFSVYPQNWGLKKPEKNIDHRRASRAAPACSGPPRLAAPTH
jgi:uncharacterized protein YijF (DUF1287 family)